MNSWAAICWELAQQCLQRRLKLKLAGDAAVDHHSRFLSHNAMQQTNRQAWEQQMHHAVKWSVHWHHKQKASVVQPMQVKHLRPQHLQLRRQRHLQLLQPSQRMRILLHRSKQHALNLQNCKVKSCLHQRVQPCPACLAKQLQAKSKTLVVLLTAVCTA